MIARLDRLEGSQVFGGPSSGGVEFESNQGCNKDQGDFDPSPPLALDLAGPVQLAVDSLPESTAFPGLEQERMQEAQEVGLAAHNECLEGCTPWVLLLQ